MPAGYIIAESIRPGSKLEGLAFTLTRIERYTVDNATDDQPAAWTMINFDFPEDRAEYVANALADVLDTPGWYTNFDTDEDKIVIFPAASLNIRATTRRLASRPRRTPPSTSLHRSAIGRKPVAQHRVHQLGPPSATPG